MATREQMIERCVQDLIDSTQQNSIYWLEDLFRNGFQGFSKMSNEDLQRAYEDAGLNEVYRDE